MRPLKRLVNEILASPLKIPPTLNFIILYFATMIL
jgi:hypothetical protein